MPTDFYRYRNNSHNSVTHFFSVKCLALFQNEQFFFLIVCLVISAFVVHKERNSVRTGGWVWFVIANFKHQVLPVFFSFTQFNIIDIIWQTLDYSQILIYFLIACNTGLGKSSEVWGISEVWKKNNFHRLVEEWKELNFQNGRNFK